MTGQYGRSEGSATCSTREHGYLIDQVSIPGRTHVRTTRGADCILAAQHPAGVVLAGRAADHMMGGHGRAKKAVPLGRCGEVGGIGEGQPPVVEQDGEPFRANRLPVTEICGHIR